MTRQRIASTALFALFAAASGCANSVTSPSMHTTLSAAELVPQAAPATGGVDLVAMPVGLGEWVGHGSVVDQMSPVALRVPDVDTPSTQWFVSPSIEPQLVGNDNFPRFDYRTIPMLPYGSFWIELTNHGTQPVAIDPKLLLLDIGGKHASALSDSGAILGRWRLTLENIPHHRIGRPRVDPQAKNVFITLPILDRRTEVAVGATWKGYVAFDIGAYTADELNALEQKGGVVQLKLGDVATVSFKSEMKSLPVVCLSGTRTPTFERCEVIAQ